MSMFRLIKRSIALLALTILVGASGLAVVTRIQGGNLLSVQSGSMSPYLNKGDLISVKNVAANKLKAGDVVTYTSPLNAKQSITHRIVELPSWSNGQQFVTKGDANESPDPQITGKDILGKLSYSAPLLGYLVDFTREPLGLIIIIYLPALCIIIGELRRLTKYYKSQLPYTNTGQPSRLLSKSKAGSFALFWALPLVFIFPVFLAARAYAQISSTATLTGNTISTLAEEPQDPPAGGGTNITCTNNTNVQINSSASQTATSGSASVNNNVNGGSAASGNASNINSTSIGISVNNGSCVPAAPAAP
ncbi:MAG: signal peptidase I [Candidatus Saccharimonadales bacterium]